MVKGITISYGHNGQVEKRFTYELLGEFVKEVELYSRFSHPNLMSCGNIRLDNSRFVICLPEAKQDLYQFLRANTLSPLEMLPRINAILSDVTRGIAYLHRFGVVHADLKPQNVLLYENPDRAVLSDFGASQFFESVSDNLLCTEPFCAPERYLAWQLREPQLVESSMDIWGLGLIVYSMFCGRDLVGWLSQASAPAAHSSVLPDTCTPEDRKERKRVILLWYQERLKQFLGLSVFDNTAHTVQLCGDFLRNCLEMNPSRRPSIFSIARRLGVEISNSPSPFLKNTPPRSPLRYRARASKANHSLPPPTEATTSCGSSSVLNVVPDPTDRHDAATEELKALDYQQLKVAVRDVLDFEYTDGGELSDIDRESISSDAAALCRRCLPYVAEIGLTSLAPAAPTAPSDEGAKEDDAPLDQSAAAVGAENEKTSDVEARIPSHPTLSRFEMIATVLTVTSGYVYLLLRDRCYYAADLVATCRVYGVEISKDDVCRTLMFFAKRTNGMLMHHSHYLDRQVMNPWPPTASPLRSKETVDGLSSQKRSSELLPLRARKIVKHQDEQHVREPLPTLAAPMKERLRPGQPSRDCRRQPCDDRLNATKHIKV